MTVIATKDKNVLSSVLMDDVAGLVHDYNFAHRQTLTGTGEYKIGQVVVFDTDHWVALASGATIDGNGSVDTGDKGVGVLVGFESLGDKGTVDLGESETTVNAVVLYQGPANIKEKGLVISGDVPAGEVTAVKTQLQSQGLKLKAVADKIVTTKYSV